VSFAVVTGASRGIGRATALMLASRGQSLALLGRPSPELEETAAAALAAGAGEARVFHADLGRMNEVDEAARAIVKSCSAPAALINNAGLIHRVPIEGMTVEQWHEQLEVNLSAPFVLTRALLPAMRAARRGRIVNVGSISSTLGTARLSAYCAAKWGLVGLTKSLAEEITDSGLMAVAVLPGSVDTRMLQGSGFPPRMTAEDVARTILFYALDAPLAHNGGVIEMFGV
jgi:3-oxoacyl-[acyl-carrier protein] reductase